VARVGALLHVLSTARKQQQQQQQQKQRRHQQQHHALPAASWCAQTSRQQATSWAVGPG
jgi:hypothetical protein